MDNNTFSQNTVYGLENPQNQNIFGYQEHMEFSLVPQFGGQPAVFGDRTANTNNKVKSGRSSLMSELRAELKGQPMTTEELEYQEVLKKRLEKEKMKKKRRDYYENKVVKNDLGCGFAQSSVVKPAPT